MRRARAEARLEGWALPADMAELLAACEQAERDTDRRAVSPHPSSGFAQSSSVPRLTVAEAARWVGVSEQAVRKAAAAGRLTGRQNDRGHWSFDMGAVVEWGRSRTP
ncbi:MAG TPA: hypothetical protein VIS06_18415 [Mycobacteriales bacterium]